MSQKAEQSFHDLFSSDENACDPVTKAMKQIQRKHKDDDNIVTLDPFMQDPFYWQRFATETCKCYADSVSWTQRQINACLKAFANHSLIEMQDTSFLGNIAYLSIHGPKHNRTKLHNMFKRLLVIVFGKQKDASKTHAKKDTQKICKTKQRMQEQVIGRTFRPGMHTE